MNVHVSVLQEEEIKIGLESEIITVGTPGDYIPVPSTAEVGQTIVVKAVDENGKPTEWEPVDAADAAEIGARLSSLANDLSDLAPAGAAVGQLFRVAAISEDGKYTMEPVDMLDVKINGESIVQDGVANIPLATNSSYGVVKYNPGYGLRVYGSTVKDLGINPILNMDIDNRQNYRSITGAQLDYAVKAAMCDGKGAAWTAEEQAAARERMGVAGYELIVDVPTLETASDFHITLDSNGNSLALRAVAIDFAGAADGDKCLVEINNGYLKFIASLVQGRFGSFVGIPLGNDYYYYYLTDSAPVRNQLNPNVNQFMAGIKKGTMIKDIWFRGTVPAGSSIQIYGIRG